MATKLIETTPAPRTLAAEDTPAPRVPVQQDPRVIDVRRRFAQAGARLEQAGARVQAMHRVQTDGATEVARLEAERDLPQARADELAAKLDVARIKVELGRTEAAVDRELCEILDPAIRAATLAVLRELEAIQAGSHAQLIRLLEDTARVLGRAHPRASDLVWPFFIASAPGQEDLVAYRRRYLAQLGWTED